MPIPCPSSQALVHEERLARSEGGTLPRAELLGDATEARTEAERLRLKFNTAVDDLAACQ
jgi:hypothetical protein